VRAAAPGLALLLVVAGLASAHPALLSSEPPAGARLAPGPHDITLRFSEGLEGAFTEAVLLNAEGRALPRTLERPPLDPAVLVVHAQDLPPGGYVLRWRALGLDGHSATGEIPYAVGDAAVPVVVGAPAPAPVLESAGRGALLLGLLVAAGAPGMLAAMRAEAPPRRARLLLVAATGLAAAGALALLVALASSLGAGLLVAVATAPGEVLAAQAALALLSFGLSWRAARQPAAWAAVGALFVHLGTSHGVAGGAVGGAHGAHLHLLALAAHLGAAAVWAGGLAALLLISGGAAARAGAIRRFSPWALGGVALLAATGAYQAWADLPGLGALAGSAYGRLLLAKTGLFALLVGLGALQQRVIGPRLARLATRPAGARVALAVEAFAMAGLLALAGVLGATATPTP